jgi:hypothetical protein
MADPRHPASPEDAVPRDGAPTADRPFMPGYGIQGADEGRGLLPWSWAVERLTSSHEYWIATVGADGHPHVTPVWAVWLDGALWFSSGGRSRKARNLLTHARCAATTDDAHRPVVVEGDATLVEDHDAVRAFTTASNHKYETDYDLDFFLANATFRLDPVWAFALDDEDFAGTPTRWTF